MIRLMKIRDRKETEISISESRNNVSEERAIKDKQYTKDLIERYQVWKKENNIEGVRY